MTTPTVRTIAIALALALATGACATRPPSSDSEALTEYRRANDPLEPLNRATFNFSNTLDALTLKPLAKGYRAAIPDQAREHIHNVLENVEEPWNFVNLLLQGKAKYAGVVLGRFVVNSTVGIGGLWDRASRIGLQEHDEDLGQTLAVWGVPEGPYLYVPLLGPSNPRDFLGFTAQIFGDPFNIALDAADLKKVGYGFTSMQILDARTAALDTFDKLMDESADPYSAIRSAYRQNREFAISDGALSEDEDDLFDIEEEGR